MDSEKYSKTTIIIIVVSLIVGFILGAIVFSGNLFTKNKNNPSFNEIQILNKEINNCIDQLNICENQLTIDVNLD
ncbi:hypothetical protein GW835_04125 [archaeon]|nr:hypothetical protein [archaeon]NCP79726.1 hypothetical protein [archaeon]NCP98359.1 hypothetical protein [archaeon]NCQ07492.1 hypothetical protein [archaeon]NCQ51283.1 hypothetical protein [archaeon]